MRIALRQLGYFGVQPTLEGHVGSVHSLLNDLGQLRRLERINWHIVDIPRNRFMCSYQVFNRLPHTDQDD